MKKRRTTTRRRKIKRKHAASAYLAVHSLTRAGSSLWLTITAEGQRIGQLQVGRGGFYWTGRHRKTSKRLSWSRFADLMDEVAYG